MTRIKHNRWTDSDEDKGKMDGWKNFRKGECLEYFLYNAYLIQYYVVSLLVFHARVPC